MGGRGPPPPPLVPLLRTNSCMGEPACMGALKAIPIKSPSHSGIHTMLIPYIHVPVNCGQQCLVQVSTINYTISGMICNSWHATTSSVWLHTRCTCIASCNHSTMVQPIVTISAAAVTGYQELCILSDQH